MLLKKFERTKFSWYSRIYILLFSLATICIVLLIIFFFEKDKGLIPESSNLIKLLYLIIGISIIGTFITIIIDKYYRIEKERKKQEEFSRMLIQSQENERKRIASELHDTIAHDVLIAKNKADIGLKHSGEKERVENILREISELSSATIKDVRNISYNLHPHQLERLGFTKTIRAIVNEVSNATDINFSFESDEVDAHLSKESEINLFRVIQESINNMIKHSGADKAEVKLMTSDDYILVVLKDNGKGISSEKKDINDTKGGFGLSGMKERIKYMKGEIRIESEENKGTSIIIRIPMKLK